MESNKEWILKRLTIEFKPGYSLLKTEDHYEGKIEFTNGDNESFSIKLHEDMAEPYLKLVSQEVIKNSQQLADRMAETLTFKPQ